MSARLAITLPDRPQRPPPPPDIGLGDGGGGDDHRLVRVAIAAHQAEAEFLQRLLLSEGIPSMITRSRGFDVPDFLAAGPRDIMVERRLELEARETLLQTGHLSNGAEITGPDPLRLLLALLIVVAVVAAVLWLGFG